MIYRLCLSVHRIYVHNHGDDPSAMSKGTDRRLAANRSPRWALMQRFEVPDYDGDGNYLTRIRLVQTPFFGVFLHRFDGPDPRPTLHDHPWNFTSFVLRGGYVERRLDPMTMEVDEGHVVRWVNRLRIGDAHAITRLLRRPTWTLMVVGVRRRTWGYLEPFGDGQWSWTEFDKHFHNLEFLRAMRRREGRLKGVA